MIVLKFDYSNIINTPNIVSGYGKFTGETKIVQTVN